MTNPAATVTSARPTVRPNAPSHSPRAVGVVAMDVVRCDPDFVIFPTYKWLLGPYGRAFLYVAKRHQNGIPPEQTSAGRRNVRAENAVYRSDR